MYNIVCVCVHQSSMHSSQFKVNSEAQTLHDWLHYTTHSYMVRGGM